MIHNYYLLTALIPLTDDTLDENGNIIEQGTKSQFRGALLELGERRNKAHESTHLRFSLDSQKVIIETMTNNIVTTSQVITKLANVTDYTEAQITGKVELENFSGTWEESRQSIVQYIINNILDWEDAT